MGGESVNRSGVGITPDEINAGYLLNALRKIVGTKHLLTRLDETRRFRVGYRYGGGAAFAVVRPGTLVQFWEVLQACHLAGAAVICQAANTGVTGGSTPIETGYDRRVVVINLMRLNRLHILRQGEQVLVHPGVTLDQLEKALKPIGREPHSVIGSTCIGASVVGGLCNNSGGSLVQRGPAYTQLALYAKIDAAGNLQLVNHLGIRLGDSAHSILSRLDQGKVSEVDVQDTPGYFASDHDYCNHVRDVGASTPARFNADPRLLYESSGCAGKLAVFAARIDTFVAPSSTKVFYIGCNNPNDLEKIRRDILSSFDNLPISGEYLHRDTYNLSRTYGKDLFLYIRSIGTKKVSLAFAVKSRFDALTERLGWGDAISDHLLQFLSGLLPNQIPARIRVLGSRFEHHLILKVGDEAIDETRTYLTSRLPDNDCEYLECTPREAEAALLNRFCVGSAIVRYQAVHRATVEDIVALDVALPRNALEWFECLPAKVTEKIILATYCGHFFCHVLHQEYLVKKGEDCVQLKKEILSLLEGRGAKYPAEHNVGHLYEAPAGLKAFYRQLDPTNSFNPGIGQTSLLLDWKEPGTHG